VTRSMADLRAIAKKSNAELNEAKEDSPDDLLPLFDDVCNS
jgi:hypothetical protein